jgi:hypothetical protein
MIVSAKNKEHIGRNSWSPFQFSKAYVFRNTAEYDIYHF